MAGKGQKKYWKAMLNRTTGEMHRVPDYGYPVTINGREFFCNYSQFPKDDYIVTDKYTGYADQYGKIVRRFDEYIKLVAERGVDVMTLPEKPKSEGVSNGNL